jgi:hypothetical protein
VCQTITQDQKHTHKIIGGTPPAAPMVKSHLPPTQGARHQDFVINT